MRRHRGVSRAELRQSAAVTVTVLLALGLMAAWSVLIPGVDAWENIVVAVIGSLRLTGPVAAAFASWVALRKRRALTRRRRWAARRPPLTAWQAMKVPLAIMGVVAGSFAATVMVLAARGVLTEQAGKLPPSGLAMGMAGLTLYVVIGWIAGWLLPWHGTPVLAALGCYGLFTWLITGSSWADRLAPATQEPYDVFQGLSAAALTDQTLWLIGVSAALLLGWAALVTRQALVLAGAGLAVLAAATGVARLVSAPVPTSAQPVVYSCQEWPITVCVHPGMRGGLTDLGAAFTTVASRLAGTPGEFTRVEQRPRRERGGLGPGTVPVHVDDLAAGFADEAVAEYLDSLAQKCTDPVSAGYRAIVMAWLRGDPLPPGHLPEHRYAVGYFSGMTESQRRGWLRMYYTDFTRCTLREEHFGGPRPWAEAAPGQRTGTAGGQAPGSHMPVAPEVPSTGAEGNPGGTAREQGVPSGVPAAPRRPAPETPAPLAPAPGTTAAPLGTARAGDPIDGAPTADPSHGSGEERPGDPAMRGRDALRHGDPGRREAERTRREAVRQRSDPSRRAPHEPLVHRPSQYMPEDQREWPGTIRSM
ncbi:hypothetical protein HNP84_007746 [Thermocatellispora tengchongensis]|uniref:Uncharacterized protein n=1 Tax=Thermocatellispora tengchongensis TaxID=1073253 RepID=A0A840PJA3_9ACTN|nr:hypothetical protein [Thermocatellispora tengchongensis]MBB5137993.1 hypothetical protein [Thermocatellispora tengchongensis]